VVLGVLLARVIRHPESGDTRFYRFGAERLAQGQPLYFLDPPGVSDYRNGTGYTYLPPFALLSEWMRWLSYPSVRVVWLLLMALALVGVALGLARLARPPPRAWLAGALTALICARFVLNDLAHGQVNALLTLLLLAALLGARGEAGWPRWTAGVALGLALTIKPTSWLLVPWLLLERRWRVVSAALLTGLALLGLSALRYPAPLLPQIGEWLTLMPRFAAECVVPHNASLAATLSRGLAFSGASSSLLPGRLLAGALVLAGLVLSWRARDPERPERGWAAVLILSALFSPVTWKAHLVVLLIPAWLIARDLSVAPSRARALTLALALACFLLPSRGVAGLGGLERLGALSLGLVLLWALLLSGPPEPEHPAPGDEVPGGSQLAPGQAAPLGVEAAAGEGPAAQEQA